MKTDNAAYKSAVGLPLTTAFILVWTILREKISENPENRHSGGGTEEPWLLEVILDQGLFVK